MRRASIRQGQEVAVTYPAPGTLSITADLKGCGSIYPLNNDESQTWIYNLPPQPGAYRLVFRTRTALGSKFTDVRHFTIRSGPNDFGGHF